MVIIIMVSVIMIIWLRIYALLPEHMPYLPANGHSCDDQNQYHRDAHRGHDDHRRLRFFFHRLHESRYHLHLHRNIAYAIYLPLFPHHLHTHVGILGNCSRSGIHSDLADTQFLRAIVINGLEQPASYTFVLAILSDIEQADVAHGLHRHGAT